MVQAHHPHPLKRKGVCVTTGSTLVSYSDFTSVISALTNQLSVSTVVGVLAATAGVVVGLVFMWWGVRKASRAVMSAFRKGKLSV